jgi:chemotaxis protein MotA
MTIPLGWIIGMVCVLGGYALHGGHISVLWQPTEVLSIVGAAVGYMVASNSMRILKQTFAVLPSAFKGTAASKRLYLDLQAAADDGAARRVGPFARQLPVAVTRRPAAELA